MHLWSGAYLTHLCHSQLTYSTIIAHCVLTHNTNTNIKCDTGVKCDFGEARDQQSHGIFAHYSTCAKYISKRRNVTVVMQLHQGAEVIKHIIKNSLNEIVTPRLTCGTGFPLEEPKYTNLKVNETRNRIRFKCAYRRTHFLTHIHMIHILYVNINNTHLWLLHSLTSNHH